MQQRKAPTVPALERGFAILERVAVSKSGLTFSQLTREFAYPKSSIHCLLVTFERLGYLQRLESSGRYVAGMKLVHLAGAASQGLVVRQKASSLLSDLTRKTRLTSHLAVLDNQEPLLVAKVEASGALPVASWVGKRLAYHCTSLGKALTAWLCEQEVDRILREHRMLRYNENTICNAQRFKQELKRTREAGYAIDDEEEEIGVRCVGVPVFRSENAVEAALSVSGSVAEVPLHLVGELATVLKTAAAELSRRLHQ